MSIELTTTEQRPEVIEKMKSWAQMGLVVHDENIRLLSLSEEAVSDLIYKPTPEQFVAAEAAIAKASKGIKEVSEERIKVTSKFDAVRDHLSAYEKNGAELIASAKKDLLFAKQLQAKEDEKIKAKEDEIKRIREALNKRISEVHAGYLSMIAIRITDAYERALNGDCPTEDTRQFIEIEKRAFNTVFETKRPNINPSYATAEDVDKIWAECSLNIQPHEFYRSLFENDLGTKFEFYSNALAHKQSSIDLAKKKQAEDLAAIQREKESKDAAEKLAAMANDVKVDTGVKEAKELKKVYELKMEDTELSAMLIIAGFCGNLDKVKKFVRVTSWRNLKVEQMANALAAFKNEDNKFEFTGLIFVQIDKL